MKKQIAALACLMLLLFSVTSCNSWKGPAANNTTEDTQTERNTQDQASTGGTSGTSDITGGNNPTWDFEYMDNGDGTCIITGYTGEPSGELIIPNEIGGLRVTEIGDTAFFACYGFEGRLVISESVESIGDLALTACWGITSIEVAEQNPVYTSVDGILFSKDKSKIVRAPEGMRMENYIIPNGVTTIGEYAFSDCKYFIGSLTIPDGVTFIGESAFSNCGGFTGSLTIPDSVTSIGESAFFACYNFSGNLKLSAGLTRIEDMVFGTCPGFTGSLIIPENVTYIGSMAFSSCKGFTGTLIIPESVTEIGMSAFVNCPGLNLVEFRGDAPALSLYVFADDRNGRQIPYRDGFKILYNPAKSGWSTPEWNGYPTYPK